MKVRHDENGLYILIREYQPGEDPDDYEIAEAFELADGVSVDVNEDGDAIGLEVERAEHLAAWLEGPIKHRIKIDNRINSPERYHRNAYGN